MRHIIVGIDCGKTAAIACVALDRSVVKIATQRFGGIEWFVNIIRETGSPVVIACDKQRPNSTVSKIATIFDSVLFTPSTDIGVKKKRSLSKNKLVTNLHERDALASAMIAYDAYANKLNQADRLAREKSAEQRDKIKAMVIKRYSIDEAIENKKSGRRF